MPTRNEVLPAVSTVYQALTTRAYAVTPACQHDYIRDLSAHWTGVLQDLQARTADIQVTAIELRVLDHFANTLRSPHLDPDAVLQWIDAYPDAVLDLFDGLREP